MGFHLLHRAGYDPNFVKEVARIMEYAAAYDLHKGDLEIDDATEAARL